MKTMPLPNSNALRFWNIAYLGVLLISVAICVFVCLGVVPVAQMVYAHALPGKPLPGLTLFVFAIRFPLALLDLAWPIVGIVMIRRSNPAAILLMNLGILCALLQILVTAFALLLPTIGIPAGI